MDDELPNTFWQIDPGTRSALRIDRVRAASLRGDWDTVVLEAEELLDEEPEHADALFLLGEAMLELGDAELARLAYERHLGLAGDGPAALLGLAIARFETCDLVGASEAAREVVRLEPSSAEGHYYLGLSLEQQRGAQAEALQCFAAAQQLDGERFPFPIQLSPEEWGQIAAQAMGRLHPRLRDFWLKIPMRLEDLPDLEELRRHDPPLPPTVGALYEGEPPDEGDPWQARPPALRLFTRNLARSPSEADVAEQLAFALQQEALDWLGLDYEELEEA